MYIHRFVNTVFASNTYILSVEGGDEYVLVDVGDVAPIKTFVQEKGGTVKAVFLTHTHYDHIYGIKALWQWYPDCMIYTSSFGKEALGSDKLNFSRYHNDSITWTGERVTVLHENDKVEVWPNRFVEVFETPGHDKSCLTYKIEKYVFSGDSYIPGIKVIASFPNSNKEEGILGFWEEDYGLVALFVLFLVFVVLIVFFYRLYKRMLLNFYMSIENAYCILREYKETVKRKTEDEMLVEVEV